MEDLEKADRSHLVPTKREYTSRDGKTYTRTVYVRPDQDEATKKEAKPKEGVAPKKEGPKLSGKGKETLNTAVKDLRKIKPGADGDIRGISITRHKDGKRFRVGGIVAHGFRAAAVMVAGLENVSATAAQFGTGSLRGGEEMAGGGQASRDVAAVGKKAVSAVEKVREAKKAREAEKAKRKK